MPKHRYSVEAETTRGWERIADGSKDYCVGYFDGGRNYSPRLAWRIMRSDGKILAARESVENLLVGQIVGYPTAEQYEQAAAAALEKAEAIRAGRQND